MATLKDRRDRQRDRTRRRLYEAALGLFEAQGFDAVTVGQIAAEVGVSVPTFYAYFATKEHIVFAVPTAGDFAPLIALTPGTLPIGERMQRMALHWVANFDTRQRAATLARWRIVASTPRLRLRAAEYERATAVSALAAFSAAGVPPTPADRVTVAAVLAALTAALLGWADSNGERALDAAAEEAFQALRTRCVNWREQTMFSGITPELGGNGGLDVVSLRHHDTCDRRA